MRRKLPHGPPPFPVAGPVIQFVTINAADRCRSSGGARRPAEPFGPCNAARPEGSPHHFADAPFLPFSRILLDSARFYHDQGRWHLHLFLVMPDHLHMLASFPDGRVKETCGAWKRYLRRTAGIRFQFDCFDHRVRDGGEFSESWEYIRLNPVRKGLAPVPDAWPHWISFDPRTGAFSCGESMPGERR